MTLLVAPLGLGLTAAGVMAVALVDGQWYLPRHGITIATENVTDLWHESGRPRSAPGSRTSEEAPTSVHPCDRRTQLIPRVRARRVLFQRVPEGKVVKNRVHLDVRVGTGLVGDERLATLEAECARLMALGAKHVLTQRADGVNESCITMQDIEGNEFCLA
ncbi:VOC family protein [Streptomyces narbonensis]